MNTLRRIMIISWGLRESENITDQIVQGKGTLGKVLNDETLPEQINLLAASLNRSALNIENSQQLARIYSQTEHWKP